MNKTIMSIGAHHDDVELRSGGTLAKYAAEDWNVVYVVATTTPHYYPWPEEKEKGEYLRNNEIVRLRKKEAERGARILGASSVHFLDFKSLYWYRENSLDRIYPDGVRHTSDDLKYLEEKITGREFIATAHRVQETVRFMSEFISSHGADIVLTHSADDCHWEHYLTARLVLSGVRHMWENGEKVRLFGWEFGGMGTLNFGFRPDRFVDITGTIDRKCDALKVFESQFKDHDTGMFAERARNRARSYGELCGYSYAEPFVECNIEKNDAGMELLLPETYRPPERIEGLEA